MRKIILAVLAALVFSGCIANKGIEKALNSYNYNIDIDTFLDAYLKDKTPEEQIVMAKTTLQDLSGADEEKLTTSQIVLVITFYRAYVSFSSAELKEKNKKNLPFIKAVFEAKDKNFKELILEASAKQIKKPSKEDSEKMFDTLETCVLTDKLLEGLEK